MGDVRQRILLEPSAGEHAEIRELWKRHSIAEDERDLPGLISTLTEDCVYELVGTGHCWEGHEGATRFYTGLLGAFPDIDFRLTDIVVGPQGVFEEADVTGTHEAEWLGIPPSGERLAWKVAILFLGIRSAACFQENASTRPACLYLADGSTSRSPGTITEPPRWLRRSIR